MASEAMKVTSIGTTFKDNIVIESLEELRFFGITSLSQYAFSGCTNLKRIKFPDNTKVNVSYIFQSCTSLEEIDFSNVYETSLTVRMFNSAKIGKLIIPAKITSIGNLFSGTTIQELEFMGDCNITSELDITVNKLRVHGNITGYSRIEFGTNPDIVFDEGVTLPPQIYIYGSETTSVKITIPSTLLQPEEYSNLIYFDSQSYGTCAGKNRFSMNIELNIAEGSRYALVDDMLIYDNKVLMVYLGDNTSKTITIPQGITHICSYAFFWCSNITIPEIPSIVKNIEANAFLGDSNNSYRRGAVINKFDYYTDCVTTDAFRGAQISELNIIYVDGYPTIPDYAFSRTLISGTVTIPDGVTTIEMYAFQGCIYMSGVTIPRTCTSIEKGAFAGCVRLATITSLAETAPTTTSSSFGNSKGDVDSSPSNTYWVGSALNSSKTLYPPIKNEGYDGDFWNVLTDTEKCGFVIDYTYTPQECTSLVITADDVDGRVTSTTIHYTAVTNGVDTKTGEALTGVIITKDVPSEEFPQNTSYTDTVEREVSFTYLGVTATTTITQGVWVDASYTIDLNSQWQASMVANPDSTLYDGVYESFSNYNVNNTAAIMYIDIVGYETFRFYVRSDGESAYDYVVVSNLDCTLTNTTTSGNNVKLTTSEKQNSGTAISNYTLVEFTGVDEGEHRISVMYRKDTSTNSGTDKGYVLIPFEQ